MSTPKRPRERESDVLVVRTLETESCGPITNDITSFLAPVAKDEFLKSLYQNKALAIKVHPRLRGQRLEHVKELLHGFNPVRMLAESNSERIMVWMKNASTLHSIKVGPDEAKGCYDAGCGLYFRSTEEAEAEFVPAFSEALGHSFASYFRDTKRRGEIETFVTHVGHMTEWHTDFQENFTIQLRGAKKWYLQRGPIEHTHRAFAPHFRDTKVLHTQTQILRAGATSFEGLPEDIDATCETVVLQPGDVLYHPAGMWHKVETIAIGEDRTNSLSINISLFPQTWSEFLGETVQQLCLTTPSLRQMMLFENGSPSSRSSHVQIAARLRLLADAIAALKPSMVLPSAVTQPIGVVNVSSKGVEREDGKVTSSGEEAKLTGPWKKNPLGVLSRTAEGLEIPLLQRPSKDAEKDSADDSDDSDAEVDDGSVDVPEGAVRFDYHSNFVCEEANIGLPPAVHTVLVARGDAAIDALKALAHLKPGDEVSRGKIGKISGLLTVLLDMGFMA